MAERITQARLSLRQNAVNSALRDGIHVIASGRNGYTALDLYHGDSLVRLLTIGTKREVYTYLGAMLETLSIIGRID
jgi:hypothetical protein